MKLPGTVMTRILCAAPGIDDQTHAVGDLIDSALVARYPWSDLGVAREDPFITIRSSLYVVAYPQITGEWPALERLGANMQCSLALMLGKDTLVVNVGPATIDYMQVVVDDENFRGRVDFQLLGRMRVLEV